MSLRQASPAQGPPRPPTASPGAAQPGQCSRASQRLRWAGPAAPRKVLGVAGTFGILRQHGVEAAQRGELQGEAERVDADADERHDARVLQGVQHAGLLPEL